MIYFKKVKNLKTQSLHNFQREMVDTHCLWPLKKERVFPRAHHVLSHLHERCSCLALFSVLCATTQHPDPASSITLPLNTIWPSSNCHENYLILLETPSCIPFQPFVRNPNSHVRQTRAYRTWAQATVPALPPTSPHHLELSLTSDDSLASHVLEMPVPCLSQEPIRRPFWTWPESNNCLQITCTS